MAPISSTDLSRFDLFQSDTNNFYVNAAMTAQSKVTKVH